MAGIVVGVDGSENSQRALEWAANEAVRHQASLTVLTVHEVAVNHWTGHPLIFPEDAAAVEQARLAAVAATTKVTGRLDDGQPVSVTVRAVSGVAAQELIGASRDADLLVVGAQGGGNVASALLGSVTAKVVHHAHCPVTVVPSRR